MVKLKEVEKKQAKAEAHSHEGHEHTHEHEEPKSKDERNKQAKATPAQALAKTATLHDLDIVLYPLVTEKAVNMIEAENKITFVVNDNATKQEIKKTVSEAYGVKIDRINVIRDMKGRKKAIVKLKKESKASDLATKLGVL